MLTANRKGIVKGRSSNRNGYCAGGKKEGRKELEINKARLYGETEENLKILNRQTFDKKGSQNV